MPQPPPSCDVAVIGAGIIGLATARELHRRHPRLDLAVLEKEPEVGFHQTGHNSGVIHAGIYYAPGSLKARMCVAGARELYEFCEERGIAFERCGKVIVAVDESEVPALDELERRGRANEVPGLARVDAHGLRELEPHVGGVAALHSPWTGIVDFPGVARALAHDLREGGVEVVTGCEVTGAEHVPRGLRIRHALGATEVRGAVFCAGLWADRLAASAGASDDPRIVPFRGAYMRLRPERRELVRGLIYPVPDPSLPFLGVHLTKHIDGEVLVGPSALLVGARDAYSLRRLRFRDLADTLAWPGTWRMGRQWWRIGLREMRMAASRRAFVRDAARYVPALQPDDVLPGPAGIRAQALARDGTLVDDFVVSRTERALHVRNAPSPAATSALALAKLIAAESEEALGL